MVHLYTPCETPPPFVVWFGVTNAKVGESRHLCLDTMRIFLRYIASRNLVYSFLRRAIRAWHFLGP